MLGPQHALQHPVITREQLCGVEGLATSIAYGCGRIEPFACSKATRKMYDRRANDERRYKQRKMPTAQRASPRGRGRIYKEGARCSSARLLHAPALLASPFGGMIERGGEQDRAETARDMVA